MSVPETSHYLYPLSRALLILPPFAGRHGCFPRGAYLAYSVPPGVGGLQSQHVTHSELAQRPFETLILTVERIGHHRAKWDAPSTACSTNWEAIFSLVRNLGS